MTFSKKGMKAGNKMTSKRKSLIIAYINKGKIQYCNSFSIVQQTIITAKVKHSNGVKF